MLNSPLKMAVGSRRDEYAAQGDGPAFEYFVHRFDGFAAWQKVFIRIGLFASNKVQRAGF
jgi:hypothetical protein